MAADITDKFSKIISGTTRPVATTLSAQKLSGATTASLTAATGWDTDTAVHGIMYRTDAGTGAKVAGSQIDWKATLSGTTLSNFTVTAGTDDTYAIGATVELAPTAAWGDDLVTGLLVSHDQDGTLKAGAVDNAAVLANEVVETAKIKDLNVTTAKIADDAVTAGKIDWASTGANGGIWWEEIGRTTLGSAGDVITVSSLPTRKYLKVLIHLLDTGGTINDLLTFNGDTGNNYAITRIQVTAAGSITAAVAVSQPNLQLAQQAAATERFIVLEIINVASLEKILMATENDLNTAGAGTAPLWRSQTGKWANTSDAISSITMTNGGSGDYAIGSEVVVLGHN